MKKKCLALCMAAAMVAGALTGCGSGEKEPAVTEEQKTGAATEAAKTEAAATEGGSIKILFGGTVPTNEKEYLNL